MDALGETLKSILAIAGSILLIYTGVREFPFKLRGSKIGTEGQGFGLYTQAMNELAERDEGFSKLRDELKLERKRGDDLEQSVIQFRRTENTNADEIRRLKLDLNQSHSDAADFKAKWKEAEREIKILRAILRNRGWLTPAIEAEIAASLEVAPDSTPPEGTASIAVPPEAPTT